VVEDRIVLAGRRGSTLPTEYLFRPLEVGYFGMATRQEFDICAGSVEDATMHSLFTGVNGFGCLSNGPVSLADLFISAWAEGFLLGATNLIFCAGQEAIET